MSEVTINEVDELAAGRQATLAALARLDRRLAWVVTLAPAVAFVVAMLLPFAGYPITPLYLWLWIGMHIPILIGVEVGFHRLFSHRSYHAHPAVRVGLAILGSMAFQGPVIWWAATHRRHHTYSDKPGDPHSPHLHGRLGQGLFHAHMGWLFVPASTRAAGWDRYAEDLYRDKRIFRVHTMYFHWLIAGFVIPGIIAGLVTRTVSGALLGVLWGGFVRIFIMNHVFYWCINSVTHAFGTRPLASDDKSTNNIWLAIPTLGQSWHNNHHTFPSSAMMAHRWFEFDIGGWVIRALEKAGLVSDVKVPSKETIRRYEQKQHDNGEKTHVQS